MLLTKAFIFTAKHVDKDIKKRDYMLLLKAGLILQEVNGIFNFLPLATKVLEKIQFIIDKNMKRFGFCKMIIPTLQDAENWKRSGRYEAYGKEMLRVRDRYQKELIYAPTAEDSVFNLVKHYVHSYRDLPKYLYQTHWKFRDEISPRNGLLRGREFLMKDGYSFHCTEEDSQDFYLSMYNAYVDIFEEIGIGKRSVFARADSGPIGGALSHEIIILNKEGDCKVWYQEQSILRNIETIQELNNSCAVLEEKDQAAGNIYQFSNGTEIGHIFNYGDKYSVTTRAYFTDPTGKQTPIYGGCYGIGVSRLLQVIVDCFADEKGIVWPQSVAPFTYHIVFKEQNKDIAMDLHEFLGEDNCLLDDRGISFGRQLMDADLLGMPWQIILGDNIELRCRSTYESTSYSSIQQLKSYLSPTNSTIDQ